MTISVRIESGPWRGKGVKQEDVQGDPIPAGSQANDSKGKGVDRSGAPQTPHGKQTSQKGSPGEEPGSSSLPPFSAFPHPPLPNSALGSVNCRLVSHADIFNYTELAHPVLAWMTALLNYKAKQKLTTMNIQRSSVGHDHQPEFTTTVTST